MISTVKNQINKFFTWFSKLSKRRQFIFMTITITSLIAMNYLLSDNHEFWINNVVIFEITCLFLGYYQFTLNREKLVQNFFVKYCVELAKTKQAAIEKLDTKPLSPWRFNFLLILNFMFTQLWKEGFITPAYYFIFKMVWLALLLTIAYTSLIYLYVVRSIGPEINKVDIKIPKNITGFRRTFITWISVGAKKAVAKVGLIPVSVGAGITIITGAEQILIDDTQIGLVKQIGYSATHYLNGYCAAKVVTKLDLLYDREFISFEKLVAAGLIEKNPLKIRDVNLDGPTFDAVMDPVRATENYKTAVKLKAPNMMPTDLPPVESIMKKKT